MRRAHALKEWQIGYLAAMIDAECHVGIQRETGRRRTTPAYVVRFELAMTDRTTVDFVNSLLPTAKRLYVGAAGRRLPYHRLRVTQQEALTLLRTALPYVQGKRRQIEICLEIDALRKACHQPGHGFLARRQEFGEKADTLWAEFRSLQLNKKPRKG